MLATSRFGKQWRVLARCAFTAFTWLICTIYLLFGPIPIHVHQSTLLHHLRQAALSRLLFRGPTTSNYRLLPLGKMSTILSHQLQNIHPHQILFAIPTRPFLLVYPTTRTSHPFNNFSMISATDPRRHLVSRCGYSSPEACGFFPSYDWREETADWRERGDF